MTTLKIKSVTLRYEGDYGWPWHLVYTDNKGEARLAFLNRREAVRFAHNRGWVIDEPSPTQEK